jgi:hypothetical protein
VVLWVCGWDSFWVMVVTRGYNVNNVVLLHVVEHTIHGNFTTSYIHVDNMQKPTTKYNIYSLVILLVEFLTCTQLFFSHYCSHCCCCSIIELIFVMEENNE